MKEGKEETEFVSPGEVLGKISDLKAGRGAYVANNTVYASLSGFRRIIPPPTASSDLVHSSSSVHCVLCFVVWDLFVCLFCCYYYEFCFGI